MPNHVEAGAAEHGKDVGDTGVGGSAGSSGDAVGGHMHWMQTGYGR